MKKKYIKCILKVIKIKMAALDDEKIPSVSYWPKEYREGFSQYIIPNYEEMTSDKSWHLSELEKFKLSSGWKKLPKDEKKSFNQKKNVQKVVSNHKEWLRIENKLILSCKFFKIKYINPEPFPLKYETDSERKMNFVKDYYWCLTKSVCYWDLPKTPYYEVWNRWLVEDEKRINKLRGSINSSKHRYLNNQLKEKWYNIPETIRTEIKEDYNNKMKKIEERTRVPSSSYNHNIESRYTQPQDEYIVSSTGQPLFRDKNWSDDRWREEIADFKANLRDF